jgi:aminoglycoside/choline kinase family phosphotransferase
MPRESPVTPADALPSIPWPDDQRRAAFDTWLAAQAEAHHLRPDSLRPASADASFRRYFRVDSARGDASCIVMDAPPDREDCRPFVQVAGLLRQGGLNAPEVLAWDEALGFLLLTDLGGRTLLAELQAQDFGTSGGLKVADAHYRGALDTLVRLQQIPAAGQVPAYDAALLRRELDLFPEWYIARHRRFTLDDEQRQVLDEALQTIVRVCEAQPAVLVHRDYHSRNLMVGADPMRPGVLDFQDAVWGPVTYDLVSLLRDAYIEWDESIQLDWAVRYWEQARRAGLPVADDFGTFWRDVEWMGLQRHLKVLGIFSRLSHRDGKDGYLKDIPLVWRYAHRVASRYSVLRPLSRLLEALENVEVKAGYTF